MKNIKVLDCTLRDGGQGLADIYGSDKESVCFLEEDKKQIAQLITNARIDIVELGCVQERKNPENAKYAIYDDLIRLSAYKPNYISSEQLFAGLFIGPDIDLGEIPEHNEMMVDCTRVILRYSELEKSLRFCHELAKKGYKTFVQPMLTMRYSLEQLKYIIDECNQMGAYALYFVDSYGYMTEDDIKRIYDVYEKKLNSEIRIGFHAHNNMASAYENVKCFIDLAEDRDIIVDSCAIGMGQGAGNLQTELLIPYLNSKYNMNYDWNYTLDVCEIINQYRDCELNTWGYSPLRLIPAVHKAAYKYANEFRKVYKLSYREINELIKSMPEDLRHRYTQANAEMMLNRGFE